MSNKDKIRVGDKVLSNLGSECEVLYVGKELVFVKNSDEEFAADFCYFRPIPTKADVERDLMMYCLDRGETDGIVANMLQGKGFTIPKKVKHSDLVDCIYLKSFHSGYEGMIISKVCDLLGDLVESES